MYRPFYTLIVICNPFQLRLECFGLLPGSGQLLLQCHLRETECRKIRVFDLLPKEERRGDRRESKEWREEQREEREEREKDMREEKEEREGREERGDKRR